MLTLAFAPPSFAASLTLPYPLAYSDYILTYSHLQNPRVTADKSTDPSNLPYLHRNPAV